MISKKINPIGIFDSGIGGLTVVRQITDLLPGESLIYFGDTARVPYGTKSDRIVREFAWEDSLFLLRQSVKMIVVACNTASAVALEELDRYLKVPVIGVIKPGARAAVNRTRNGRIGVIGTQATIDSGAYQTEIQRINPDYQVVSAACPLFVPLAEEGWVEGEVPELAARMYLSALLESDIDTLILGCTHYPLLKPLLSKIAGPSVSLIDSAEATALVVAETLSRRGLLDESRQGEYDFYVSDLPRKFEELGMRFLGRSIQVSIAEPWKATNPTYFTKSP
ncbi:MAG: glutamate racemase [bacterium]|nr:glutamate racemase [bacterium]